jgi:regulator of sigma E protease
MIPYIWGSQEVVRTEGLYVNPVLNQYGLETGDEILEIDGEAVSDVGGINEAIMLFDGQELLVLKPNGQKEIVVLGNDAEYEVFSSAIQLPVFLKRPIIFDTVVSLMPASAAGLMNGDSVISIDGQKGLYWLDFVSGIQSGVAIDLVCLRGKDTITTKLIPEKNKDSVYVIGVQSIGPNSRWYDVKKNEHSLSEAISIGIGGVWRKFIGHAYQMKFLGTEKGIGQVGSVIKMASYFPKVWHWPSFWSLTGYLSIVLAFMNLLPIPALDGGHAMFTIYEIVFRRKPGKKFLEKAQLIGMVLLMTLMVVVLSKDIIEAILN